MSTYDPAVVRDRVYSEIKAKMQASRGEPAFTEPKAHSAAPKVDPFFSHPEDDREGYVRLSTLVPNWNAAKAPIDPWVRVFDPSGYSEDVKARVPEVDKFYRPNMEAICLMAYALEDSDTGIFLSGLPSVGKSSLAQYFAAITNRPFYRFNYNGTQDAAALLGTQSAKDGSTHWHDGLITEAIKVPNAILLHDEPMMAPAEVLAALQYVLERNGKLLLAEKPGDAKDKIVTPAKGVRMIFADNTKGNGDVTGKFVGTQPANSATLDRLGTFIEVHFLDEQDEVELLKGMFPHATPKLLTACVKVANLCRSAYAQGQLSIIMSQRVVYAWMQHALNLRNLDKSLEIAYLNRFDDSAEKEAVKGFLNVVVGKGR